MLRIRKFPTWTSTALFSRRFVSSIFPNPKKVAIVSQYPTDTFDFSFLPPEYSVQFLELTKIQSKGEFIEAVKKIPKDAVVINIVDNCEDSANEAADKYISSSIAKEFLEENGNCVKAKKQVKASQPEKQQTYFKVCGLTAIDWYNRLELPHTGASAHNFATKKTDLKVRGVPTPRHVVIRDRKFSGWKIQFRGENTDTSKSKTGVFRLSKSFPLKFPVIVKPLKDYGGSTFIQEKMKCETMAELQQRVEAFPVSDMIVEEFIVGEEFAVFIWQNASNKAEEITRLRENLNEKLQAQNARFRRMATQIRKEKNMKVSQKQEIFEKLVRTNKSMTKKITQFSTGPSQVLCKLTDPIQVILPSPDAFQHEEMKWRLVNSVYERMTTGKKSKEFMMEYRMIPQELFSSSSQRCTKQKLRQHLLRLLEGVLDGSLTKPFEQSVRDAYLHSAIQKASRRAWRLLKHDGYFRYDLRVMERSKAAGCTEDDIRKKFRSTEKLHALSTKELVELLPKYTFDVYIVDANPYCSLYGIPANYDEADSMLTETPKLSHKKFTEDMIKVGIHRELTRRLGQLKLENGRQYLKDLKHAVLSKTL